MDARRRRETRKGCEDMRAVVIDDHPDALRQIIRALQSFPWDMEVSGFGDFKRAMQYVRERRVSLVVMETTLSGADGIEIARQIKQACPSAYLVFMTDTPNRALDAFRVRADGYLLKPVNENELRRVILRESIA